jgi:MoaD family protein
MVTLKVFGELKTILVMSDQRIDIEGHDRTIGDILELLTKQYGQQVRKELLDSKGKIKPRYAILVNGRNIASVSGLETRLKDEDIVAILPVVEGG